MSFQKYGNSGASSTSKYVTIGGFTKMGEKNPGSFTGRYLGKLEGPNKFEPGKTRTLFGFDTDEGRTYVNGNTRLVLAMKSAEEDYQRTHGVSPIGATATINFTGMEKLEGGKTVKLFDVLFDSDDQVDVDELQNFLAGSNDEGEDYEEHAAKESVASISPSVQQAQHSSGLIATQQAKINKVKEVLNRSKTR